MRLGVLEVSKAGEAVLEVGLDRAITYVGGDLARDLALPDASLPEAVCIVFGRGAGPFWIRVVEPTHAAWRSKAQPAEADEEESPFEPGDTLQVGDFQLKLVLRNPSPVRAGTGRTQLLDDQPVTSELVLRLATGAYAVSPAQTFDIGADRSCDLTVKDDFVSGFHAQILKTNDRWTLVDLGSSNGTRLNGVRVQQAELPIPSRITVGKTDIEVTAATESKKTDEGAPFHGLIGQAPAMKRVFRQIAKFAPTEEPVLVFGESGVGKELVAEALHAESARAKAPFLPVNCSALPASLFESEFFGFVKGAFSGAVQDTPGLFEKAAGGTLFLDEIGELPLEMQPKLLRVLETGKVRRIGAAEERPVDVRIVAATHRNLLERAEAKAFREDLYYRLAVLTIEVPPLRDRPDDIPALARHLVGRADVTLSEAASELLRQARWPGNVRQLRNVLRRAALLAEDGVIEADNIQVDRVAPAAPPKAPPVRHRSIDDPVVRSQTCEAYEKARGSVSETARILGITKSTAHYRLKRLGLI